MHDISFKHYFSFSFLSFSLSLSLNVASLIDLIKCQGGNILLLDYILPTTWECNHGTLVVVFDFVYGYFYRLVAASHRFDWIRRSRPPRPLCLSFGNVTMKSSHFSYNSSYHSLRVTSIRSSFNNRNKAFVLSRFVWQLDSVTRSRKLNLERFRTQWIRSPVTNNSSIWSNTILISLISKSERSFIFKSLGLGGEVLPRFSMATLLAFFKEIDLQLKTSQDFLPLFWPPAMEMNSFDSSIMFFFFSKQSIFGCQSGNLEHFPSGTV